MAARPGPTPPRAGRPCALSLYARHSDIRLAPLLRRARAASQRRSRQWAVEKEGTPPRHRNGTWIEPVSLDRFTIALVDMTQQGGTLAMWWDHQRAEVPFTLGQ